MSDLILSSTYFSSALSASSHWYISHCRYRIIPTLRSYQEDTKSFAALGASCIGVKTISKCSRTFKYRAKRLQIGQSPSYNRTALSLDILVSDIDNYVQNELLRQLACRKCSKLFKWLITRILLSLTIYPCRIALNPSVCTEIFLHITINVVYLCKRISKLAFLVLAVRTSCCSKHFPSFPLEAFSKRSKIWCWRCCVCSSCCIWTCTWWGSTSCQCHATHKYHSSQKKLLHVIIYTKTKSSLKRYFFVHALQYRVGIFGYLFLDSPWEYSQNIRKLILIMRLSTHWMSGLFCVDMKSKAVRYDILILAML